MGSEDLTIRYHLMRMAVLQHAELMLRRRSEEKSWLLYWYII